MHGDFYLRHVPYGGKIKGLREKNSFGRETSTFERRKSSTLSLLIAEGQNEQGGLGPDFELVAMAMRSVHSTQLRAFTGGSE